MFVFLRRKPSFQQPDGISLTLQVKDMYRNDESFIYSSLFTYRKIYPRICSSQKSFIFILLLMCGDIETCPGPESQRVLPEAERLTSLKGIKILHPKRSGIVAKLRTCY